MRAADSFRFHLLKYFRRPTAMSRRELARQAGVSHVHVLHILSGRSIPTLTTAEAIAGALGCDLVELIGSKPASTSQDEQ